MPKCDFQFIEITLRHGYSPVKLVHIFRAPFPKNTAERLLLMIVGISYFLANLSLIVFEPYVNRILVK